jgi:hypothetical protein
MNDIAKKATMEKLLHTIEVEKLESKSEIARKLGIRSNYISMILNEKQWPHCPKSAWEGVLNWLNSGWTLRQYAEKYPAPAEVKTILVPKPIEINMPTDLQEKIKEADKQMDAILKEPVKKHPKPYPVNGDDIKEMHGATPDTSHPAEQIIREAVKSHPLAVEALQPKQEFTDTARLKIALDIEINLVVNGHKVSML